MTWILLLPVNESSVIVLLNITCTRLNANTLIGISCKLYAVRPNRSERYELLIFDIEYWRFVSCQILYFVVVLRNREEWRWDDSISLYLYWSQVVNILIWFGIASPGVSWPNHRICVVLLYRIGDNTEPCGSPKQNN